jgi:6-methylsalicylate decarboxylase
MWRIVIPLNCLGGGFYAVAARRQPLRRGRIGWSTGQPIYEAIDIMSDTPHRIDVHHHILPPRWLAEESERMSGRALDFRRIQQWTPSMSLDAMDRNGIATTVTSISTVIVRPNDPEAAHGLARDCNEFAARLAADHPGRFGVFALLPLPHIDACLREIEYAADTLKADGFKLQTSYEDKWPGDPAFAPVFAELNRRKAVIFFHPTVPGCCTNLLPDLNPPLIEYPFDTTRAILSLVFGGTVSRCPDIRFIFAHGGGTVAMLAHRIAGLITKREDLAARLPDGVINEFRKLYFDIVSVTNPPAMAALRKLTTVSKLLFGTDIPYVSAELTVSGLRDMGFSAEELRAIESGNALTLMPSLAR